MGVAALLIMLSRISSAIGNVGCSNAGISGITH
jgi:hypothetical protein